MRHIRVFIAADKLDINQQLKIAGSDFDYLIKVMRLKLNSEFALFNAIDGDFLAEIVQIEKKYLIAQVKTKIADLKTVPNITLAFAPVKNVRIDFVAAKATELGVAKFQPIITQHSIVDKINLERFKSNIKEACEQCERNDMAQVVEPKKLAKFLSESQSEDKILILCDESKESSKASEILAKITKTNKEIIILVGPEGGFSKEEFIKMRELKNLFAISLGPRILRADTAVISALTLVQEFLGDF